jgi:peptidoglycan/LPS O-acetylase OafA/YrhL
MTSDPFFRTDIQGLRGIAVLLVVVYHSGSTLPGGFIGVDVFFVISGFVITKLLMREQSKCQSNTLGKFYFRRVLRLLPAASVMVCATILFSMVALAPNDELAATLSLARQSLYGANFYQLSGPGYFATAAPLQHMWSLAVEEQFYFIYPIIFLGINFIFKRYRIIRFPVAVILVGLFATSIAFAELFARGKGSSIMLSTLNTKPQTFSFFMMPSRAWEFAVGAAVAMVPPRLLKFSSNFANPICLIGFTAIIFSSTTYSESTVFPGLSALVPVIGTALIIFAAQNSFFSSFLLNLRMLKFFGNISYSWYLWHWPFIVFSEILFPDNSKAIWIAIISSLPPSIISYRFFEQTLKLRFKFPTKNFVYMTAVFVLLPFLLAQVISTVTPLIREHSVDAKTIYVEEGQIHTLGCADNNVTPLQDFCTITNYPGVPLVYLVGDSQAAAAADGAISAAKASGLNIAMRTINGCPPLDFVTSGGGCWLANESDIKSLNPEIVVVASSLTYYAPETNPTNGEIPKSILSIINWISRLESQGRKIIVFLEVPKMDMSARATILQPELITNVTRIEDQSSRIYLEQKIIEAFVKNSAVSVVSADNIFCPGGQCNPRQKDKLLYRDPTHLSQFGSLLLKQLFLTEFSKLK